MVAFKILAQHCHWNGSCVEIENGIKTLHTPDCRTLRVALPSDLREHKYSAVSAWV